MDYEFRVGDYVETIDGQIGCVTTFIHSHDGENTIFVNYKDGKTLGYKFFEDEPHRFFNRIGIYDFTKKEKKKIEPLEKDLPVEMKVGDKVAIMKQHFDGNYNTIIYSTKMIDKINELVDAVNLLLDKSIES